MAAVKKITTCEKVGCKETDLVEMHSFGRSARLCDDHTFAWQNSEEARRLNRESKLCSVAVDAHVNAGKAEEAKAELIRLFVQEDENLRFFNAWLARIG